MKLPEGMTMHDFSAQAEGMTDTVLGGADAKAAGDMAQALAAALRDRIGQVAPATVLVALACVTGRYLLGAPPASHPFQPAVMARLIHKVMELPPPPGDEADGIGVPMGSA